MNTFDKYHFVQNTWRLKLNNRILGYAGSLCSRVFPLFESAELVSWAKFLEVIGGRCVPKVDLNYISANIPS